MQKSLVIRVHANEHSLYNLFGWCVVPYWSVPRRTVARHGSSLPYTLLPPSLPPIGIWLQLLITTRKEHPRHDVPRYPSVSGLNLAQLIYCMAAMLVPIESGRRACFWILITGALYMTHSSHADSLTLNTPSTSCLSFMLARKNALRWQQRRQQTAFS